MIDEQWKTLSLAKEYRAACANLPAAWARVKQYPVSEALESEQVSEARHEALKDWHAAARRAATARDALLQHVGGLGMIWRR